MKDSTSCLDGLESPKTTFEILEKLPFSNDSANPIQIWPQKVKLSLRKGEKFNLNFQFKLTENFPVDLYFLMDESYSMKPVKNRLASLGNELAATMKKITTNFRLGFGTFIEKNDLVFQLPE